MSADEPSTIRLDQFLKLSGVVSTGGQAKLLIQDGVVTVNGQIETRRRRQLKQGDVVEFDDYQLTVE
jgi:ribosome-associated protein